MSNATLGTYRFKIEVIGFHLPASGRDYPFASMIPFVYNMYRSYRFGEIVTADDPWGFGNSLEWATSSPPPRHNFTAIPRIRSERPAFEAHYPHLLDRLEAEAHAGPRRHPHPAGVAGAIGSAGARQGDNDPDPTSGEEA